MIFLDLNFDELLGFFLFFTLLVFISVALVNGFMRLFDFLFDGRIKRLFHYHYHYRDQKR